jgi:beta-fructofuranosidase
MAALTPRWGPETEDQRKARFALAEQARGDHWRLKYHLMPEGGWMNDPNGLIQYQGKYHVFYQHNPDSAEWGPMHWGHAVSSDLARWEYLPFALVPDQSYEQGCFSGSAVENRGELSLLYTAHHEGRSPKQAQCAAFSSDGVNFTKYEKNPVIPGPPPGFGEDFRDPKVFRRGELWYLVAGCTREGRGGVLLYSSPDLRRWEYRGLASESDGTLGEMWECPDLFPLGEAWTLMCSPINMKDSKCVFFSGDMDFETGRFTRRDLREVDYGSGFYAPQSFADQRGRRILLGWMDRPEGPVPTQKKGWAGCLSFPRELFREGGEIRQRPVEELALLRRRELFGGSLSLKAGKGGGLAGLRGDSLEFQFTLPPGRRGGKLSLYLRSPEDRAEKTVLSYDFNERRFTLDKRDSGADRQGLTRLPPVEGEGEIPVHILVDASSVEIFLYGGKYAVSNRIYPGPSSLYYDIIAEGGDLVIPSFRVWELG